MPTQTIQMNRVLTTPALVAFGMAYIVPLGIFTTYGQVTYISQGHLPIAYIITLVTMLFTALSYCRMTNALPLAGSAYSYVQRTFGSNLGFLVGWVQILDYLFLPILNYLVLGLYLNEVFPAIPVGIFIIVSIVAVSVLNIIGVRLVSSVNFTLIAAQFVFIILFVFLCFSKAEITPDTLVKPLLFGSDQINGLFAGAAILCLTFLGFDAIATMAEESNDARRTLPRAIILTVVIIGTIFLVVSYGAHLLYPDWQSLEPIQDMAGLAVSEAAGGTFMYSFFLAAYLTGVFASAMSAQTSVSRIFYAMGREGVLPKNVFYHLHQRFKTPYRSILIVATISLLAIFIDLNMVISMISFGALGAFTFVNLSVIKHFIINQKQRSAKALFHYGLLPFIGVIMTCWLWTSLEMGAIIVGMIWLLVGLLYLLILTRGFSKKLLALPIAEIDGITK